MSSATIENVSDTSVWVAYYRAKETERPDALFQDHLAKELIGDRGRQIAEQMSEFSVYTEFNVITRTLIIDEFIRNQLKDIDTVVNLGAGLDTRPYRMDLPSELRWIEVDYPHIIELKNDKLAKHQAHCLLERVALDLADDQQRRKFLKGLSGRGVLVLTEGVIPYLSEDQVAALGRDLLANPVIKYWIGDYIHPRVYKILKRKLSDKLKNAPMRFFPPDYLKFFANLGWIQKDIRYSYETGVAHGRKAPMPLYGKIMMKLIPSINKLSRTMSGYVLYKRA